MANICTPKSEAELLAELAAIDEWCQRLITRVRGFVRIGTGWQPDAEVRPDR